MNLLKQLAVITGICLAGEVISGLMPFTFPGSVISMIMVFVLLQSKVMKEERIKQTSDFLLQNMAFFFLPAATAIIKEFGILKTDILVLFLISILSTLITFLATYYTVCFVAKLTGGDRE